MTARLRFAEIAAYTPAEVIAMTVVASATATVTLDGVDLTLAIPQASAGPGGIEVGDIAWLGQEGRSLVWLGYAYQTYGLLGHRGDTYGWLYSLDIPYSRLRRVL